ncbi:MAG: hypothetical protein ACKVQJ_08645 [Pyrinomonadaceae bacterium]
MNDIAVNQTIIETYKRPLAPALRPPVPLTIFQRLQKQDASAFVDCVDAYADFIWALATRFTNSEDEAKAAVAEMESDIRRCAETGAPLTEEDARLSSVIAWRRLIKFLE